MYHSSTLLFSSKGMHVRFSGATQKTQSAEINAYKILMGCSCYSQGRLL